MITNILTFEEFSRNEKVSESVNEKVEIFALAKNSSSKSDFRNKLVAQLRKDAPLLADDENFVNNIVDNYEAGETEE